ncbi:MAG TPA: hypothetical protein ENJ09_03970 [Planctomycetes bacterium]|nr:hypothetical protein [Planctomycetota bacterium]
MMHPVLRVHSRRILFLRASSARTALALALSLAAQGGSPALAQSMATPTTVTVTAAPADRAIPMPTSGGFGFEIPFATIPTPPPTPPYAQWGPWSAYGTSGVTENGSALLAGATAPEGTRVGYVTGKGLLRCSFAFSPGIWRLRYEAAARSQGGLPEGQVVRIRIGGVVLSETSYDAGFGNFVTRPLEIGTAATLTVEFEGTDPGGAGDTAFLDKILLERIHDWQDPTTWLGNVPGPSNPVIIPENARVGLTGPCFAREVTVGGALVAPDVTSTLDARWVRVTGADATLQVGTKDTPFTGDFTLTLLGSMTDPLQPDAGTKFLVAEEGGIIDLHGEPRVSWSRLDATVDASTIPPVLTLAQDVDWEKDDWLILAGSENQNVNPGHVPYGGDWTDYSEKVQIKAVLGPRTVELYQPLNHLHHGGTPILYPTGGTPTWRLDQRAEVGLLTHNVKVQGDASSDLFQPSTGNGWVGFGGHIMIRHSATGHGVGRLSNVELYRMGQSKVGSSPGLGRYPMHWHSNLGDGEGQYIEHSSIHHTYNRAVTVHGTENVRVEWNVAYDNLGHAVYLEDGSERFNHINYNLVLSTQIPDPANAIIDSDHFGHSFQNQSPSSFWITNPENEMIGNVAAGTVGTGFWFAFPRDPAEPSYSEPYFAAQNLHPNTAPLGTFKDNVCHGARSAFDVNDSFTLNHVIQKNVGWEPSTTAYLENFTVYSCATGLYAGTGKGDLSFTNAVLADNSRAITFAAYHTVEDSVIVADSHNSLFTFPATPPGNPRATAYSLYDGAGTLRNCHLVGYDVPGTSLLHNKGGATRHVNHHFSGLTFEPLGPLQQVLNLPDFASAPMECGYTPHSLYDPRTWMVAVRDDDGSLTGQPGVSIIGNHPMMLRTVATGALQTNIQPEDTLWDPAEDVWLSPSHFGLLRIRHNNPAGNPVQGPTMTFTRDPHPFWTTSSYVNCSTVGQHKQFAVVLNEGYEYGADWGGVPPTADQVVVTLDDLDPQDDSTVRLTWPGAKSQIQLSGRADGAPFPLASYPDLASLETGGRTGYFLTADQSALWLRFVSTGARTIEITLDDVLP